MSDYLRRDVCLGLDNDFHKLKLVNGTNRLSIDNRPELENLSFEFANARLVHDGSNAYVITDSQNSREVRLLLIFPDNTYFSYAITEGIGAGSSDIRFDDNHNVEIYNTSIDQSGVDVFDIEGKFLRHYGVPYSAKGILYIDNFGTPIMTNDPSIFGPLPNGIQGWYITRKLGWIVSQIDNPSDGIILINPSGIARWIQWSVQIAPRLAVRNDMALFTIAGFDTPEPDNTPLMPYGNQPVPGYNPKNDLMKLSADLDAIINKL